MNRARPFLAFLLVFAVAATAEGAGGNTFAYLWRDDAIDSVVYAEVRSVVVVEPEGAVLGLDVKCTLMGLYDAVALPQVDVYLNLGPKWVQFPSDLYKPPALKSKIVIRLRRHLSTG